MPGFGQRERMPNPAEPRPNYQHCSDESVPADIRFDVPEEFTGKDIQIAFGGDAASPQPHAAGASYKRVRNVVTGRTTFFALLNAVTDEDRAAWRAFEGSKARDAELLNERRGGRRTRSQK